jgi:hypothetical protein
MMQRSKHADHEYIYDAVCDVLKSGCEADCVDDCYCDNQAVQIADRLDHLPKLVNASMLALRSYEHGNASPALAKDLADKIEDYNI